jgi:hypothetical protein
MPRPPQPSRKPVTSDPDRAPRGRRGVTSDPDRGTAVNSGTDPQRPGSPTRPGPPARGGASGDAPSGGFDATRRPEKPGRGEDVEGTKTDPDDAL